MQKVLVTGATGMLGSRLVFDLYLKKIPVRAIYRNIDRIKVFEEYINLYGGNPQEISGWVEWFEADLNDYMQLVDALVDIDMVFNCAAMVSFIPSDRSEMFRINIKGTANLVNACIESGVKKICHVSSIAALGPIEAHKMIDESSVWIPEDKHSAYSITKFHSEMEVWRGVEEGLCAVIVNPSVIIGPGDWESGSSAFFGQMAVGLRFYSSGSTGFVDVRDVSSAILLLTNKENFSKSCGKRFLLNAANLSYRDFFTKIAHAIGVEIPTIPVNRIMLGLAWRIAYMARKITGLRPRITQETALSSSNRAEYDGSRITREFGFSYRPIDESINDIGNIFLKNRPKR